MALGKLLNISTELLVYKVETIMPTFQGGFEAYRQVLVTQEVIINGCYYVTQPLAMGRNG